MRNKKNDFGVLKLNKRFDFGEGNQHADQLEVVRIRK